MSETKDECCEDGCKAFCVDPCKRAYYLLMPDGEFPGHCESCHQDDWYGYGMAGEGDEGYHFCCGALL